MQPPAPSSLISPTPKRLFIIDAMAMIFRNYHAFGARQLMTSKGLPSSALFGSAQFLVRLLEVEQPDYFAIAMDTKEPTFRHLLFPAYKANRKAMPEDLAVQLPYLQRLFAALGCKVLSEAGLEADDLIGSLVQQFASPELHCYIVSADKDFAQLVSPNVTLYSPQKANEVRRLDPAGVVERFGCQPKQIIDMLALLGDSSDNVPGVPGIGEKGAQTLIQAHGSLEGLFANLDSIGNKRYREALSQNQERAFLARQLVTIKTDATLGFALEALACVPATMLRQADLLSLCDEMELKVLAAKLRSLKPVAGQLPSGDGPRQIAADVDYFLITNAESLAAMLSDLSLAPELVLDTETTGLDVLSDTPVGISFAAKPGVAYYVPLLPEIWGGDLNPVLAAIKNLLANSQQTKIGHNLKFDLHMLANIDIHPVGPFADTMIAAWLLNSVTRTLSLDACCLAELNYAKIPTSSLIGPKATISMRDVPLPELCRYAGEDADLTLQLYQVLVPKLRANDLWSVFQEIEMPLLPVLTRMERTGIFCDSKVLHDISEILDSKAKALRLEIIEIAGEEFNLNSTKQLQHILFEKLRLQDSLAKNQRLKKTKSGYSTDVSVLELLSAHPVAQALLQYRQVTKIKNSFVDTLPQLIHKRDGRIHTSYHQTGTATGRLSSTQPNLQNIPIRSEFGKEIRMAFRPEQADWVLLAADYSQVELRLLAHLSDDPGLKAAFANNEDVHQITAARIFGVLPEAVTRDQRAAAKAINFGIIYGMGPRRLAQQTGVSTTEAKAFIERYFATYPRIKGYIDSSIQTAKSRLYTTTMTGRRRPLPEIASTDPLTLANAQNIAVNSPVQGSAADLIKLAMIRIQKQLDESGLSARMLLQVHDELVCECPQGELEATTVILEREMREALALAVPLRVDVGSGIHWLEAH